MKNTKTLMLVEGAIMIALASVLSLVKVYKLPWGGSITLLSMLPICMFSIKYGIGKGFFVSFVYALIQTLFDIAEVFSWGLTPEILIACLLLDYILAYTVIGIAGIFRKKGIVGWVTGCALALFLRFVSHFLSGVLIWHSFGDLWDGFSTENEYLYSLLYNGSYMLPEIIFTVIGAVILFSVPQTKRMLSPVEKNA